MILSPDEPGEDELNDERFLEIYQEATDVYGLIHARFIMSPKGINNTSYLSKKSIFKGLAMMREKLLLGRFGVCPRVLCER